MARSGLIQGTVSQQSSHYRAWIYWEEQYQEIDNNRSRVTVEVLIDSDSSGWNWNGTVSNFKLTINGSTYTSGNFNSNSASGWTYSASSSPTGRVAERIFSRTVWVNHNSNGSKTFSMSTSFSLPSGGYGPGNVSVSGSGTLDTIPRASNPTVNDSYVNYGTTITIYTNRASTSFTHTLRYNWNGRTGTIATGVGASTTWTIPNSFMNYIPNATSTSGTIYCDTYSNGNRIGTESVKVTTVVPSSIRPSFSGITHSEYVTNVSNNVNTYVQSLSRLNLAITGATGAYSSTIESYAITFDGKTYNRQSAVSSTVNNSGTLTITAKVVDSRGRSYSSSTNVTVLAYSTPKVTSMRIGRANADFSDNKMGTYAKIILAGTWTPLNDTNNLTVTVSSRLRGATSWETKENVDFGTLGALDTSFLISGYNNLLSYEFLIEVADEFNIVPVLTILSTGQVTMSWGREGIGVGKVWERGAFDVYGDAYLSSPSATPLEVSRDGINTNVNMAFHLTRPEGVIARYLGINASGLLKFGNTADLNGQGGYVAYVEEMGTNSNGTYFRYSDGWQICLVQISGDDNGITTTNAYGSVYRSDTFTWYFPATFANSEDISVNANTSTYIRWMNAYALFDNRATIVAYGPVNNSSLYSVELMAIGKWK